MDQQVTCSARSSSHNDVGARVPSLSECLWVAGMQRRCACPNAQGAGKRQAGGDQSARHGRGARGGSTSAGHLQETAVLPCNRRQPGAKRIDGAA